MKPSEMRPKMARRAAAVPMPRTPIRSAMTNVRPGIAKEFAAGGAAKERQGQTAIGKVKR